MDSITTAKYILGKYYPRSHLLIASALSLLLMTILFMAPERPAHGNIISTVERTPVPPSPADQAAGPGDDGDSVAQGAERLPAPVPDAVEQAAGGAVSDSASPAADQVPAREAWTDVVVRSGDNLSSLFTRVGLSAADLHHVLDSNSDSNILNRLHPGYQLSFHIPETGRLQQLEVLTSPLSGYTFTLRGENYEIEQIERAPEIAETFRHGHIENSLFMAGQQAGIPVSVTMEMANIFGGVIDFILDPRQGDQFSILYEEKYLDGQQVGTGEIIAARFINRGREHIALRYQNEDGDVGYFNPEGESMRKAFLRSPLDVFRISSNFNPNRRHPILNTIRAHKGTDYAAPTGTPVRATSDGTVTWVGRKGSFGKLIVIKHNGSFETKYAHLNDYANGIGKGDRVRQGEVIGYVGATGGATGPHLHYEFLVDGVHKDPRTILDELPQAISLESSELPRFRAETRGALERFRQQHEDQRLLLTYNSDRSTASGE